MNKNEHQITKDISRVIKENGDLVIISGVDEDGVVHISNFGYETKALKKMMPYMGDLSLLISYYFRKKSLEKNNTYILKFYIDQDGWLTTESFGAMPEISKLKRVG